MGTSAHKNAPSKGGKEDRPFRSSPWVNRFRLPTNVGRATKEVYSITKEKGRGNNERRDAEKAPR